MLVTAITFDGSTGRRALPTLHVDVYATKQGNDANLFADQACTGPRAEQTFHLGRPKLRARLLAATGAMQPRDRMYVFACGPVPLVHEVWDHVTDLRGADYALDLHRETFEL